ncbi:MAG: hypothetical protein WC479_11260 [Candidatus Izemoplasmatales bacterium]
MAKIPIGINGEPMKKRIPPSKRVCPYSIVHPTTGRLVGNCHEARIVGVLTKMEEDEDIMSLMKRVSKIVLEVENICPLFESCKLQAKCEQRIRVTKDDSGDIISKEPFPVKTIKTSEFPTIEEVEKRIFKRRKLKTKDPDFIGKAAKKRLMRGTKKQSVLKFGGEKILIN